MKKLKNKIANIDNTNVELPEFDEKYLLSVGLKDITLRDYQLAGVNWLVGRHARGHGAILADEMGLGKTCQSISFLVYLNSKRTGAANFLILSPLSVIANWQSELSRFAPGLLVVSYVGDKAAREELRSELRKKPKHSRVVLTTYEICLKDDTYLRKLDWDALIVDEAHRLKNRQSLLHQTLLDFDIEHRLLLTGTPVQNNLKELYALLCFVAPHIFKERWMEEFADTYQHLSGNEDRNELHDILKPFLLRRVKAEVVKDLPLKSEIVLFHGMSALQKKYYKAILTKDTSVFENANQSGRTQLLNILMQLRKCVNHPYLFDGVEPEPFECGEHLVEASGKLILIDQLLTHLRSHGHKVLLFSQMTRMLDVLQDYLTYRGFTYERLDGSVRGEERYLAVQNFNEDDDTFLFLLSTKAGGVGLNLVGADTVIFVDSDFNPQNDLQAAARAHRIGQTRPVKVIRLVGSSTVEEIVLRRAEAKLKLTDTVIEGGQFSLSTQKAEQILTDDSMKLQDILKFGVDKLFADEEHTLEDVDFESILSKSKSGEWVTHPDEPPESVGMEVDEAGTSESMYMFEGTDYSSKTAQEPSDADVEAFTKIIQNKVNSRADTSSAIWCKRGANNVTMTLPTRKTRTPMTEAEKAELKKRRAELAALREKQALQEQLRRDERKRKQREDLWKKNGYISCNIALADVEDDEASARVTVDTGDDDSDASTQIHYVIGDVTQPQTSREQSAVVVHCVDDSGSWGSGGIFSALDARSDKPAQHYALAADMKDLNLGDAHLVIMDEKSNKSSNIDNATSDDKSRGDNNESCDVYVSLMITQQRNRKGVLSGILLSHLSAALKRLASAATSMKASVHLPRIGYKTPGFNWYGTERLVRKHLASHGIPTYIYYYPRKRRVKRPALSDSDDDDTPVTKRTRDDVSDTADAMRVNRKRRDSLSESDEDPAPSTSKPSNSKGKQRRSLTKTDTPNSGGGVPRLPEFLTGVTCYLHALEDASLRRRLARRLIAYNGDVHKDVEGSTTHIVVDKNNALCPDLRTKCCEDKNLKLVHYQWLLDCFDERKLLDEIPWIISRDEPT